MHCVYTSLSNKVTTLEEIKIHKAKANGLLLADMVLLDKYYEGCAAVALLSLLLYWSDKIWKEKWNRWFDVQLRYFVDG